MLIAERRLLLSAALEMARDGNRRMAVAMRRQLSGATDYQEAYDQGAMLHNSGLRLCRRYMTR